MKKLVLFTILLIISTAAFSAKIVPELPASDIEGAKDHPILKRYADSYIVVDQCKSFDEFTFPLSKLLPGKRSNYYLPYTPEQAKTVEGPYTRLVYLIPTERSPLEIIRNYQDEILDQGGKVLYECKREECGGDKQRGISHAGGRGSNVDESLAMFLRPRERLGLEDYSQGFCATTGNIMDQRYLLAELPDVGAYISVHTYTIKSFHYTNCNAFIGRTVAVVDFVLSSARPPIVVSVLNSQYLLDNEDGIYARSLLLQIEHDFC